MKTARKTTEMTGEEGIFFLEFMISYKAWAKEKAEELLNNIRKQCEDRDITKDIRKIKEMLHSAEMTLEDIGTSNTELENLSGLFVAYMRGKIILLLGSINRNCQKQDVAADVESVRRLVKEAGIKMSEIAFHGSALTEERLNELISRGLTAEKSFWVVISRRIKEMLAFVRLMIKDQPPLQCQ